MGTLGEPELHAKVGDVDIHYEEKGRGTPVAILGGPWLGHAYLRGMDPLADTHRVIYHDARGTGRTPLAGRARPLSLDDAVADLDGLREALGIETWSLVAHSFGAHVGMLYAGAHPDRVASLVVCNAGPPLSEPFMKTFFADMMSRRAPEEVQEMRMLEDSGAYARRDVKAVERSFRLTYLPFFNDRKTAEEIDLGFTETTAKNAPGTEMRLFQQLQAHDPVGNLARIACPTLVVHAERDPLPEAWSRFLAESIPGARLAVLPAANHFAFAEDPTAFFGVVKPFLDQQAQDLSSRVVSRVRRDT